MHTINNEFYSRVGNKSMVGMEISPLRHRMCEDMRLAGLAESSQESYIYAVTKLQKEFRQHPAKLSERELRDCFIQLRDEKKVAKGTFQEILEGKIMDNKKIEVADIFRDFGDDYKKTLW